MPQNPESVGAYVRGEVLPEQEKLSPVSREIARLSVSLLSDGHNEAHNQGVSDLVGVWLERSRAEGALADVELKDLKREFQRKINLRGDKPDEWIKEYSGPADLSNLTLQSVVVRAVAQARLYIEEKKLSSRLFSGGTTGGGDVGNAGDRAANMYSRTVGRMVEDQHIEEDRELAGLDLKEASIQSMRERIHEYVNLTTSENRTARTGFESAFGLVETTPFAHDYSRDILQAAKPFYEASAAQMGALSQKDAMGGVLRVGIEGYQVDALVTARRVHGRLFLLEENGRVRPKEISWGVREILDGEGGYCGERIRGTDPEFVERHRAVLTAHYPDFIAAYDTPEGGRNQTQSELLSKFAKHPVYFSDKEYVLTDGTKLKPGVPLFSFALRLDSKTNLLTDMSRRFLLTTDYEPRPNNIEEVPVPPCLNPGEKVRSLDSTGYKHEAAWYWIRAYLKDKRIKIGQIVGATPLYGDMKRLNLNQPTYYEFAVDGSPWVAQDIQLPDFENNRHYPQYPLFKHIPKDEWGMRVATHLFAERFGAFYGETQALKTVCMLLARENPVLYRSGDLIDQGAIYSQKQLEYLRSYQIGEAYSQMLAYRPYPGVTGRKWKYWATAKAAIGKPGVEFFLYDDSGITQTNDKIQNVEVDGVNYRIGKNEIGWILWDKNKNKAKWQKGIDYNVFFAPTRNRRDNADRNAAMKLVESARWGMQNIKGTFAEKVQKTQEQLAIISGEIWKKDVTMIVEDTAAYAVEPRSRAESWELVRGMPAWARVEYATSNHKLYLVWAGEPADLDPIEYKGILGLEAKVERQSHRLFGWRIDRSLVLKQAKYAEYAERGSKTAANQLRTAMIQGKDPQIAAAFGFGVQPMDSKDLTFKTVTGVFGMFNPALQLDKKITEEWGKQCSEVLAEIGSSYADAGQIKGPDFLADLVRASEEIIDNVVNFAELELEDRVVNKVDQSDPSKMKLVEEIEARSSGPGVPTKPIQLVYAGGESPLVDNADRLAGSWCRRSGLRVLTPYKSYDDYVDGRGLFIDDPNNDYHFVPTAVENMPRVVSGSGRWLDRVVGKVEKTEDGFGWEQGSLVGEQYKTVFGHHDIGVFARRASVLKFIGMNLRDAGVLSTANSLGITAEMNKGFMVKLLEYKESVTSYLRSTGQYTEKEIAEALRTFDDFIKNDPTNAQPDTNAQPNSAP